MGHKSRMMIFAAYMLSLQACSSSEEKSVVRAVAGGTVRLDCNRTVQEPVDWSYQPTANSTVGYFLICANGAVYPRYQPKFELSATDDVLIIYNVTVSDSGVYWCTEQAGIGIKHCVELYVGPRNETETAIRGLTGPVTAVIAVSVSIGVVLLAGIGVGVGCLLHKKKKHKMKPSVEVSQGGLHGEELRYLTGPRHETETPRDVCDQILVRGQLPFKVIATPSPCCGITYLNNKTLVLCFGCNQVTVFDGNYENDNVIEIPGLQCPQDVVACTEDASLYIADYWAPGCIWRVTEDGSAKKFLPNVSLPDQFRPRSLSITSNRLLVTTDADKLMTFEIGTRIRHIVLSLARKDRKVIRHAVETTHDSFIICYWEPRPAVSEVDVRGNSIRIFERQLSCPSRVLQLPNGNILVVGERELVRPVDSHNVHNWHILLLNNELQLRHIQLDNTNELVNSPLYVCYVQQTSQLIVGSTLIPSIQIFANA